MIRQNSGGTGGSGLIKVTCAMDTNREGLSYEAGVYQRYSNQLVLSLHGTFNDPLTFEVPPGSYYLDVSFDDPFTGRESSRVYFDIQTEITMQYIGIE